MFDWFISCFCTVKCPNCEHKFDVRKAKLVDVCVLDSSTHCDICSNNRERYNCPNCDEEVDIDD